MDVVVNPRLENPVSSNEPVPFASPNNSVPKRKRKGRPSLKPTPDTAENEKVEAAWTTRMIDTLLDERTALKDYFLEAQNRQNIGTGWSKITLAVTKLKANIAISRPATARS